MNRIRTIGIYVDGNRVGGVSNGDAEEFQLEPGEHVIRAKIDWCASNPMNISVAEGETKTMLLSAYKYAHLLLAIEMGLVVLHFILNEVAGISYVIFFALPFLLVSAYYTTIGRNKYLWLREDELSFSF